MKFISTAEEEPDMTPEEVEALIEARLNRDFVWSPGTGVAPVPTIVTGGGVWDNRLEEPNFLITTAIPGVNRIAEYAYVTADDDAPIEIKQPVVDAIRWQTLVNRIECWIGPYMSRTNLSPTQFVGIEFQSISETPGAWPVSPSSAVAQLRWKADTDSWEIYCAKGDGSEEIPTPGVVTPLIGAPGIYDAFDPTVPHGAYVALEYYPAGVLKAFVNGVHYATYSGPAFPDFNLHSPYNGVHAPVSGIFATTGTNAAGSTTAYFGNFKHTLKNFLVGAA